MDLRFRNEQFLINAFIFCRCTFEKLEGEKNQRYQKNKSALWLKKNPTSNTFSSLLLLLGLFFGRSQKTHWLHREDLFPTNTPDSIFVRKYLFQWCVLFFLLKLWNFTLFYSLFYCWLPVKVSAGCCHKLLPLNAPTDVPWGRTDVLKGDMCMSGVC